MELHYMKMDNSLLFKNIEKSDIGLSKLQNYIPIYDKFFSLTEKKSNSFNLNNENYLLDVTTCINRTNINAKIMNKQTRKITNKNVFLKYGPIIDPQNYITGKYESFVGYILSLPSFNETGTHEKARDPNNSMYVDGFFYYLNSKLKNTHNFINGTDFYGAFLAVQERFIYDISDDIEYNEDCEFFNKNNNVLFSLIQDNRTKLESRKNRPAIVINSGQEVILEDVLELCEEAVHRVEDIIPYIVYEPELSELTNDNLCDDATCSSNSSNSTPSASDNEGEGEVEEECVEECGEECEEGCDKDDGDDGEWCSAESDECDEDEEEEAPVFAQINNFPVQIIAMEQCENTLDSLLPEMESMTDIQIGAIVLQVLFSLIVYQKAFSLTHNDLHTNNIMYITTDIEFINYKIDGQIYKVPTFGKIFKIIDFGRAIYKFKGDLMCSDCFSFSGDASTQYNFPPYYNEKKQTVEPNFSFDLCRLGCAMYDEIVENCSPEQIEQSPILTIILDWCKDDKGRNMLYKKSGEERYPDFKLYKMIARSVHNHTPTNVLKKEFFNQFKTKESVVGEMVDIDSIKKYF